MQHLLVGGVGGYVSNILRLVEVVAQAADVENPAASVQVLSGVNGAVVGLSCVDNINPCDALTDRRM